MSVAIFQMCAGQRPLKSLHFDRGSNALHRRHSLHTSRREITEKMDTWTKELGRVGRWREIQDLAAHNMFAHFFTLLLMST